MATQNTMETVLSDLAAEIAAMEANERYKGFTVTDLRTHFDRICDPADWKGPIAAAVSGESVMLTVAAIEFFTATTPSVSLNTWTMQYIIESPGYRRGPAGDH